MGTKHLFRSLMMSTAANKEGLRKDETIRQKEREAFANRHQEDGTPMPKYLKDILANLKNSKGK